MVDALRHRRILFGTAAATLVLAGALLLLAGSYRGGCPHDIVDLELAADPVEFERIVGCWIDSAGRGALTNFRRVIVGLDFLFPVAYGVLGASILAFTWTPPATGPRAVIVAIPLVAAAADFAENAFHLHALAGISAANLDRIPGWAVTTASATARVKFLLLLVAGVLALLGLVLGRLHRVDGNPGRSAGVV